MGDIEQEAIDKLAEEACKPLEVQFANWYFHVFLNNKGSVDGDVFYQVGAALENAFELGYRAGMAAMDTVEDACFPSRLS